MATGETHASSARTARRFPVRRTVQWALGIGVGALLIVGAYKTLALNTFSGSAWRSLVVFGIAQGAIYAMIALGYTMVYGVLRMINFAHGEVFMLGAFASFFIARPMKESGMMDTDPVVSVLILLIVGMAGSVGVAILLERVAYRPLRNSPRLVPLITAIGASLFLQSTAAGLFGAQSRGYPRPEVLDGTWTIAGIPILRSQAIVIVVAILSMVALSLFVARTKTGRSMRAVAQDRETASLMGIDVDSVVVKTFAIGGLLAGIAAVLYAMTFELVEPTLGFVPGIKAFTAAVLGGIGSILGASIGGFALGLVEAVAPSLVLTGYGVPGPNQLRDVIAFSILVFVLIFRPGGILGSGEAEKV